MTVSLYLRWSVKRRSWIACLCDIDLIPRWWQMIQGIDYRSKWHSRWIKIKWFNPFRLQILQGTYKEDRLKKRRKRYALLVLFLKRWCLNCGLTRFISLFYNSLVPQFWFNPGQWNQSTTLSINFGDPVICIRAESVLKDT